MVAKRLCVIKTCPGKDSKDIMLFLFPTGIAREEWIRNISPKQTLVVGKNVWICSRHFEDKYKRANSLHNNAIPTLALGHTEPIAHDLTTTIVALRNTCKCNVPGCSNYRQRRKFRFPSDRVKFQQWIAACGIKSVPEKAQLYICSIHFDTNMMGSKKLLAGAFPVKHLGGASTQRGLAENVQTIDCEQAICSPSKRDALQPVKQTSGIVAANVSDVAVVCNNQDTAQPEETLSDEALKKKHAKELRTWQRMVQLRDMRIKILEAKIEVLKKKQRDINEIAIIPHQKSSNFSKIFAKLICGPPIKHYTEDEKNLAKNIQFLSVRAYRVMRDYFGFNMPHQTSLLRWKPTAKDSTLVKCLGEIEKEELECTELSM